MALPGWLILETCIGLYATVEHVAPGFVVVLNLTMRELIFGVNQNDAREGRQIQERAVLPAPVCSLSQSSALKGVSGVMRFAESVPVKVW
jgi:hypothetical protein